MKRFYITFSIVLSCLMASAAYFDVGQLKYSTEDSNIVVCVGLSDAAQSSQPTSITIPGRVTYNGTEYRVNRVAMGAFANNTKLITAHMGWGITIIDKRAFMNCSNLQIVRVPSSVDYINEQAFAYCTSLLNFCLASVAPPSTNSDAFDGARKCNVVTSLYSGVAAYNSNITLSALDSNGKATYDGTLAYDFVNNGCYYIYSCPVTYTSGNATSTLVGIADNVTTVTLSSSCPDNTSQVYGGGNIFYSSTTKVGNSACEGKTNLASVYVTNPKAYDIGDYAFRNCTNLTTVKLCGVNLTVGSYAFAHCTKLTTLDLKYTGESTSISTLSSFAFLDTGVSEVYIPENLRVYGTGAFASCPNLTKFTVSANNAYFRASSNGALYSKSYSLLYQVGGASTIGNTIAGCRTIMNYAWYGNTKVSHVEVHYGVTKIQGNAFGKMPNLKSVKIPSSVTYLTPTALDNLTNVETIYINLKTPPDVDLANLNPECKTVNIPYGCFSAYYANSHWRNFTDYYNGAYDIYSNQLYYSIENVGSYTDTDVQSTPVAGQATLVPGWRAYNHATIGETWTIPGTINDIDGNTYIVSAIAPETFRGHSSLKGMKGGAGIKTIGAKAFRGCTSFTTYGFRYVKEIGDSAFLNCTSLATIDFGNKLEKLGVRSFYGCTALTGEIVIPASVKKISSYSFAECTKLNSLFLYCPNSAINKYLFRNNASDFKCYVPLANLYNIYIWADWTNSNGTQAKDQFMPYVIPKYGWMAISCFKPIELPTNATFYYIATINDGKAIAMTKTGYAPAGYGLLLKGKKDEIYRLPIVSTAYGNTNMLKGVEGASITVSPTASNDYYYFDEEKRVFHKIQSSRSFLSGSAYLQTSSGLHGNPLYVDEMEYPLTIAGVRVTERNKNSITGSAINGTVKFDPSDNNLLLQDATIDITGISENAICYEYGAPANFKIKLVGENKVLSNTNYVAIDIKETQDFTIYGSGSLHCGGALYLDARDHITNDATMSYIKDCELYAYDIMSEDYVECLTINNADVTTEYLTVGSDHNGYKGLTLVNSYIALPANGIIGDIGSIIVNGEIWYGHVEIKKGSGPTGLKGDVNGDGRVNVSDVSTLINMILGIEPVNKERADVNGDDKVNVSDVTALINIILGTS